MLHIPSITSPSQHEVSVHHNQPKTCSLHGWWSASCVAVGLRLGVSLCKTNKCQGAEVDHLALHGLSCRKSQGRHPPCSSKRSSQKITGHSKDSLSPQSHRCYLLWWKEARSNFCDALEEWPHFGMQSYLPRYIRSIPHGPCSKRSRVGSYIAKQRRQRSKIKYAILESTHHFALVAVETSGVFGPEVISFTCFMRII